MSYSVFSRAFELFGWPIEVVFITFRFEISFLAFEPFGWPIEVASYAGPT
jgi:hypothetical protein